MSGGYQVKLFGRIVGWGLGAVALVAAFVIVFAPTFSSPDSRLWSSGIGYPAIARKFGWAIPVETTVVVRHSIAPTISADGTLEYEQLVPVNVEVPGIIQGINVQVGDLVARGDSLIELDSGGQEVRAARLQLENEKSEYDAARRNLERQQDALGKGLIPAEEIERYEGAVRRSKASMAMAQEKLLRAMMTRSQAVFGDLDEADSVGQSDHLRILAPINGRVKQVNVSLGENLVGARGGAVLLGDRLMFRSYFDQREFAQITIGDAATVHLLARPGLDLPGRISRIEPFVSGAKDQRDMGQPPLTFTVWIELTAEKGLIERLATGMNGYCIVSYPVDALVIPVRALMRYSGGKGTVLAVNGDSQIEVRAVEYAVSDEARVSIVDGLHEGDRVVTAGQVGLMSGDLVEVQ
jgi:RND family efflux transporter MFP subunit